MWSPGIWLLGLALFVLALMPVWVSIFFFKMGLRRKRKSILKDLRRPQALKAPLIKEKWTDESDVEEEINRQYSIRGWAWPVGLLSFFYVIHFLLSTDLLRYHFDGKSTWIFPVSLVAAVRLPLIAFSGVYLFNLGHNLRRLYLSDLTADVFWDGLERLLLVIGLAVVLMLSWHPEGGTNKGFMGLALDIAFFALGFLAKTVLQSLLDRAARMLGIRRAHAEELPLSLIQGISFWHEHRLEEEGIENTQNLATCDVVDLAIKTRYNLRTLVDWVDQAVLLQRLGSTATKTLREQGFISGAIDLAWASPANSENSDSDLANQIAKTLHVEPIYMETLMDSLYEDKYVQMLWQLWQSDLGAKRPRRKK